MKKALLLCIGTLFALASCDGPADDFTRKNKAAGDPSTDPSVPQCTEVGQGYVGFAGTKLEDKRANARIGVDRARMKPYSALRKEYQRTIGVTPGSLESAEPTFGQAPERFAVEPRASAIQVFTAYRVAFDGCLTYAETVPAFASAPTADSAGTQCRTMARKFWSRAPSDERGRRLVRPKRRCRARQRR